MKDVKEMMNRYNLALPLRNNCNETLADKVRIPMRKKSSSSACNKNVVKQKRLKGEEYIGFRQIKHHARPLLPSPCSHIPTHLCTVSVSEESRQVIYKDFRDLSTIDDQRQFISRHIEQRLKKRATKKMEDSRRSYTYMYSFTVNGLKRKVCRQFFMATLNVTDALLRSSVKKTSPTGIVEKDKRGRRPPKNKLTIPDETFLRDHIKSFSAEELHYNRLTNCKKYLESSLNISKMYKMYKEKCQLENRSAVCLEKYRSIFREFNLGFFKPNNNLLIQDSFSLL